jgi:hypothetical protein
MSDPELRGRLGAAGKHAVHSNFSAEAMAESTLAVYSSYVNSTDGTPQNPTEAY